MPLLLMCIIDANSELLKFLRSSAEELSLASQFAQGLLPFGKDKELMNGAGITLSDRVEL